MAAFESRNNYQDRKETASYSAAFDQARNGIIDIAPSKFVERFCFGAPEHVIKETERQIGCFMDICEVADTFFNPAPAQYPRQLSSARIMGVHGDHQTYRMPVAEIELPAGAGKMVAAITPGGRTSISCELNFPLPQPEGYGFDHSFRGPSLALPSGRSYDSYSKENRQNFTLYTGGPWQNQVPVLILLLQGIAKESADVVHFKRQAAQTMVP